jgi:6-phosphofructokinase 1
MLSLLKPVKDLIHFIDGDFTMALKGNVLLGQSGGPTAVINATLAGLIDSARRLDGVRKILGMRFGIEGLLAGEVIDLSTEPAATLRALRFSPGSALGSSRHKLKDGEFPGIFETLKKYDVRYVFMIGGNDTMDTIHRLEKHAVSIGYELQGIGLPKTVDNDLFGTDHTPGYGSAARYVSLSVKQAGLLACSMQRVDQVVIHQTVGRDAGWLAASSALAREREGDAPHLIYMPERPFDMDGFLADVQSVRDAYGWASVVIGEGISYADKTPVSSSRTLDTFKNTEFGAMGGASAALVLLQVICRRLGWRGEFQVTESLQMCAADRASETDRKEAYMVGKAAVRLAEKGVTGVMVSLERGKGRGYACGTGTVPLSEVAARSKPMPPELINAEGNGVTPAFLDYARPLVGELPSYARLRNFRA